MSDGTPIQQPVSRDNARLRAAEKLLRSSELRAPRFLTRVTRIRCLNSTDSGGFGYLQRDGLLPRVEARPSEQPQEQSQGSLVGEALTHD